MTDVLPQSMYDAEVELDALGRLLEHDEICGEAATLIEDHMEELQAMLDEYYKGRFIPNDAKSTTVVKTVDDIALAKELVTFWEEFIASADGLDDLPSFMMWLKNCMEGDE